ncbi:MAG TPA: single-stranded-DNA-specific exonuclease RecJ, partial [Nitrospirota bacterium]
AAFTEMFEDIVTRALEPEDFKPYLRIDDELALDEIDWELYEELSSLSPFGAGNPEPVLQARGLEVMYPKVVGRNHVKMKLRQHGRSMPAIGFNMGDIYQSLAMERVYLDAAFCLDMNEWQGEKTLQLNIKDIHI